MDVQGSASILDWTRDRQHDVRTTTERHEWIYGIGSDDGDACHRCRVLAVCTQAGPDGVEKHGVVGPGDDVSDVGVHVSLPAAPAGCA